MSTTTKALRSQVTVILALAALLAGGACVPSVVWAEPNPEMMKGPHPAHDGHMHDFAGDSLHKLLRHQKDLGLSEEQSAKIKAIATDYAKARIREEADLKLAEVDVETLVHDEKAELSAIEAAMKKSESAHMALRLGGVKALRTAAAVLTPKQREKWHTSMMDRDSEGARSGVYADGPKASSHDLPKREGS